MKNPLLAFWPVATAFLLLAAAAPLALAQDPVVEPTPTVSTVPTQTQTTVTTTGDGQTKTTQTTVTTAPTAPVPSVTTLQPAAPVPAARHMAELEIVLTQGDVQAYFGRAPRGEKFSIGDASLRIKLPSTATVTKLASRDKTSEGADKVTVDNPWHVMVPFNEGGRYVFNIVEWDDNPVAALVLVKVDGVVKFQGHGSDDDFKNWPEAIYGEGVHRTGSREIAFDVD
jgi:hypothetical protein